MTTPPRLPDQNATQLTSPGQQSAQSWEGMGREMQTRDEDAHEYEGFFTSFQSAVEMKTYRAAFADTGSSLGLEVGCGTGRTIDVMSSPKVVGIDLSRRELLIARRRFGPEVALIQASATHLPFRDAMFDQVLCAGVMQHLPNEEMCVMTVQEMARVATRPARVVVAAHNYPWVVQQMFPKEVINHNLMWRRFSAEDLEGLLLRALSPCRVTTKAICHLPRWRIGNRLGKFGVWADGLLSQVPGLKHVTGALVVAEVDALRRR